MQEKILLCNALPIGFDGLTVEGKIDVGISAEGNILSIEPSGEDKANKSDFSRIIDLGGRYLSPGWIDLHTHIYHGATDIGVRSAQIGPRTGVACLVDAGSAGEANFAGFKEFIVKPNKFPIRAFLNIGSIGCTATNRISEISSPQGIDLDRTLDCARTNRNIICGIKVRVSKLVLRRRARESSSVLRKRGLDILEKAKDAARTLGLPLMVHVGEPPLRVTEIIPFMEEGDILTHCFNCKEGANILDDPNLLSVYQEAQNEGIHLDLGHGSRSFSFQIARESLKAGLLPFTISTDVQKNNLNSSVWDLPTTMSKMKALGLSLEQVVERVTSNPAQILGESSWIELQIGAPARLTAFEVVKGTFELVDRSSVISWARSAENGGENLTCELGRLVGSEVINPLYTLWEGQLTQAENRFMSSLKRKQS